MVIPIVRLTLIVVGTAAYLGLAVLGWGGLVPGAFLPAPAGPPLFTRSEQRLK
jgi:hypothetical protein